MDDAILTKNKSYHNTWTNLRYEEQQAAKLPAHLQAEGLSKSIVRPSEGRGTLVPR